MTTYPMTAVRQFWVANGGSPALAPIAVGVAFAESNGWAEAVSPADDHGLWQINRIHFAELGVTDASILDPNTNAQAAIRISGNGTNWAPWCTCWNNPKRDCGHGYLPVPQRDSPAWNRMIGAIAVFGSTYVPPTTAPPATNLHALTTAWGQVQALFGVYARATYNDLTTITEQIGRLT